MQTSTCVDERGAWGSGRHQPGAETELFAERNPCGLGGQHRVGTGVDGEAVDAIGSHQPAGTVGRLEQNKRHAARRELVRG